MPKIIFCFAGTGDIGESSAKKMEERSAFDEDVIRIHLTGCQHPKIGGSVLFPDLERGINNIKDAFDKEGNLNLGKLIENLGMAKVTYNEQGFAEDNLGGAIVRIEPEQYRDWRGILPIDKIVTQGFSRGAVSALGLARSLDDLGKPIHIIANQPVPGGSDSVVEGTGIYTKYKDLSQCKNIKSATTLIASHNLENGVFMNAFFQQMIANFPESTKVNNWMMPHQGHLQWFYNTVVSHHMTNVLKEIGFSSSTADHLYRIEWEYARNPTLFFTPKELAQKVFGDNSRIIVDPAYSDMMKRQAGQIMSDLGMEHTFIRSHQKNQNNAEQEKKDTERARAIVALNNSSLSSEKKVEIMRFMSSDASKANQLIGIINKANDCCAYIEATTRKEVYQRNASMEIVRTSYTTDKSQAVHREATEFKTILFEKSYNFLTNANPGKADKIDFIVTVAAAEKKFHDNATELSRDYDGIRVALKVLLTALVKLTGLHVLNKDINRALDTGFLFHTRSSKIAHHATSEIINSVTADPEPLQDKQKSFKEHLTELRSSSEIESEQDEQGLIKPGG